MNPLPLAIGAAFGTIREDKLSNIEQVEKDFEAVMERRAKPQPVNAVEVKTIIDEAYPDLLKNPLKVTPKSPYRLTNEYVARIMGERG